MIAAAICLFASELMTMFDFTPPGGESLCAQGAGDRHSNAQMVIAVFAVIATIAPSSRLAPGGDRGRGRWAVLALLVFLISDLRVVNAAGSLNERLRRRRDSFFDAEAVPQGGFWLELVGRARARGHRDRAGDPDPGAAERPAPAAPPAPAEPEAGEGVGTRTGRDSHDAPRAGGRRAASPRRRPASHRQRG